MEISFVKQKCRGWALVSIVLLVMIYFYSSCARNRLPVTIHGVSESTIGCLTAEGFTGYDLTAVSSIEKWANTKEQAQMIDKFISVEALWSAKMFEVSPSFAYYDDGNSPNAFAHPHSTHGATDGSIRIGGNLVFKEFEIWRHNFLKESIAKGKDPLELLRTGKAGATYSISAIIAHEMAHILQMKRNSAQGGRNTELQADFLAGWYFANMKELLKEEYDEFHIEKSGLLAFWSRGDYYFNSRSHHGTPKQRADAFAAGLNLGNITLKEAWNASVVYRLNL